MDPNWTPPGDIVAIMAGLAVLACVATAALAVRLWRCRRERQRLAEQQSQHLSLLGALSDNVYILDAQNRFTATLTPQGPLLAPHEAYTGKTLAEALPFDVAAQVEEALERVERGETVDLEYDWVAGHELQTSMARIIPLAQEGPYTGALALVRNITAERRTLERLATSEAQLREAQHIAKLAFWRLDLTTHELQLSDSLLMVFDNEIEEGETFHHDRWLERVHPDDVEKHLAAYARMLSLCSNTESTVVEERVLTRGDTIRWLRLEGYGQADEDGDPLYLYGISQDITARKQAEEALHKERAITDAALDHQVDTFFVFDPSSGRALRWNRAFGDISGYSDKEIASLPAPTTYYDADALARATRFVDQVVAAGQGTIELDLICKDGRRVPTEYRVAAIYGDDGRVTQLISIGRDITERQEIAARLAAHREHLEALVAARTAELQKVVSLMSGREHRMAELKQVIQRLRQQLADAGMVPCADDPLANPRD